MTEDGVVHSTLLQNAETVKLVCPQPVLAPTPTPTPTPAAGHTGEVQVLGAAVGDEGRRQAGSGAPSGPAVGQPQRRQQRQDESCSPAAAVAGAGSGPARACGWRSVSVSELVAGDEVYVLQQEGSRHTGLAVAAQNIWER